MLKNKHYLLYGLFSINFSLFIYFIATSNYSFLSIFINSISIISLWVWLFLKSIEKEKISKKRSDGIIFLFLFLLAFCVYIYNIDVVTPGIQSDELAIAQTSEQILSSSHFVPFLSVNLGHPTPLLYLTGVSINLLGRSVMAIRLPYILFGSLSVVAFYILLRLFFTKSVAVAASLLFLFSYPVIILSRLAYEVMPALFFQILTIILLYLAWKKKNCEYYMAVGLALGAGLYTYLGFRSFFVIALVVCGILMGKAKLTIIEKLLRVYLLLIALFIAIAPLFSYGVIHFNDLTARTNSISIFSYHLSPNEFAKEFGGNISRLSYLFFFYGDPQIKNNPSGTHMFDIGTFILFVTGLFLLFRKNKIVLFLLVIFSLSPLINDIFTLERIADFHEYGQAHPNTLRIAGIIPIIYFGIAYGIDKIKPYFHAIGTEFTNTFIYFVVVIICFFNWYSYFYAPFSGYVYNYNGAIQMDIVNAVNNSGTKEVAVSPTLYNDARFTYFIKKDITVNLFAPKNYSEALQAIATNQLTIVDPVYNRAIYQQLFVYGQNAQVGIQMHPIMSPLIKGIDALAFTPVTNLPLQQ